MHELLNDEFELSLTMTSLKTVKCQSSERFGNRFHVCLLKLKSHLILWDLPRPHIA